MIFTGRIINIRRFEDNPDILQVQTDERVADEHLEFDEVVTIITGPEVYIPRAEADAAFDTLRDQLNRIASLHSPRGYISSRDGAETESVVCVECRQTWPCETLQILQNPTTDKETP